MEGSGAIRQLGLLPIGHSAIIPKWLFTKKGEPNPQHREHPKNSDALQHPIITYFFC